MDPSLSDAMLLRMYLRGERSAFDALYRRHCAMTHATAYRLTQQWDDAEEVLQEVFLKLARNARELREPQYLRTWLYRTTINAAYDALRQRQKQRGRTISEQEWRKVVSMESMRRETERREARDHDRLLAQVEALIPRLPERQGAAVVLRVFQGLSFNEIAQVMQISEGTAKSHYSLAVSKLKQWCEKEVRDQRSEASR
ncbi:RNA polymerase sigma factor [Candidatus Sumerlaeota bacterium]|nr:RNA polymerase sigma factor [Candidatus Sumerlaeota bacterium]